MKKTHSPTRQTWLQKYIIISLLLKKKPLSTDMPYQYTVRTVIWGGGITVYPMLFYAHGFSWWRLQMELFSALLALCGGIHRSPVDSPHTQRPVTRSFDVFFHLSLNKRLSKQSILFETPWRSLWRLCNVLRFSCGLSLVDLSVIRQWDFTRTSTTLQIYG